MTDFDVSTAPVRNPRYNARGTVDCEIEHPDYGWMWFTANPNDSEPSGRALYEALVAGDHGAIAEFEPPVQDHDAMATVERDIRDGLLREIDPILSNPFRWADLTVERQEELKAYRLALLDIPQQTGFPYGVTYPVKPSWLI